MLQGSFSHCAADPRFAALLQESSAASAGPSFPQLSSPDAAHGSTPPPPPPSDVAHPVHGAVTVFAPVDEGAAAAAGVAVAAAAAAAADGRVGGVGEEEPVASGEDLLRHVSLSSSVVLKGGGELQLSKMLPGDSNLSWDAGERGTKGGSGGRGQVRSRSWLGSIQ